LEVQVQVLGWCSEGAEKVQVLRPLLQVAVVPMLE